MVNNVEYTYLNSYYKKRSQAQLIYYLATIVVVTKLILAYSEIIVLPPIINSLLNFTFILLMLLKTLMTFRFKAKKIYIAFIVFAMMALYTSIQTENYIILFSALGIIAIKNMNVRNIIRVSFYTKVFWLTIHFVSFAFAMAFFPQRVEYSLIGQIRYRIFLSQPNTCAMLFLWAIFEYMYLNYERLSFNKFLGCTFVFGTILYITKSKTCIAVYALQRLFILLRKREIVKKVIFVFSKYGYIILSIFFVSLTVIYTSFPFARTLNVMLTGRLAGAAKAYSLYGFTMLGQYMELGKEITWDAVYGVTSIWLENAYSMMFLNYGIVYAILIAVALWYTAGYLTDKDKIFVCAMLIYGIGESYIVNIFLCFPLLIVAAAIYNKQEYLTKNYNSDYV